MSATPPPGTGILNQDVRDISTINNGFTGFPASQNPSEGRDYAKLENARKLSSSEYTFNSQLGYISLKSQLNPNQVLAVAYEYSYNGTVYRVGDLTTSGINPPNRLFVKIFLLQSVSP